MKKSIFISLTIVAAITYLYFFVEGIGYSRSVMLPDALFEDIKLKASIKDNSIKVFALAKNNPLAMIRVVSGNPLPEEDSIVIGYSEAKMMKEEDLFKKAGDGLSDFFGIDTRVEGVLGKTGTMIDDFYFLSKEQYEDIQGEEVMFVKLNEGMPKLFYIYGQGDPVLSQEMLEKGSLKEYRTLKKNGKYYYPLIIGASEAEMMEEEGMFSDVGDTIERFFGKDVIIAGILKKQENVLDMTHFSQFEENDLR